MTKLLCVFLFSFSVLLYAQQKPEIFLKNRVSLGNDRYHTFYRALELLNERGAKVCVETGTARFGDKNFRDDGGSTIIFGHWAQENNAILYSVDIDPNAIIASINASTSYHNGIEFVVEDSISFLKNFSKPIDFLYLDSCDFVVDDPFPSQLHHLEEIKAAYPHLTKNSIVMIDDCKLPYGGKGALVIQYLQIRGWKIIENKYQVILAAN